MYKESRCLDRIESPFESLGDWISPFFFRMCVMVVFEHNNTIFQTVSFNRGWSVRDGFFLNAPFCAISSNFPYFCPFWFLPSILPHTRSFKDILNPSNERCSYIDRANHISIACTKKCLRVLQKNVHLKNHVKPSHK